MKKYDKNLARQRGERWAVEWCKSCPMDDSDTADLDNRVMVEEWFHERADAETRMREIESQRLDFFGQARMVQERFEIDWIDEDTGRNYWKWQEIDDGWYVENGEFYQ